MMDDRWSMVYGPCSAKSMILLDILALLGVAFVLPLFAAAASSMESLLWWASWDRTVAAYPAPVLPEAQ